MDRDIRQIVAEIDALSPASPDDLDLDRLQALADEYFSLPEAPVFLDVWFRLYERYPESDGHGVFWSILHGIEAQPGSGEFVVASVRCQPTRFPLSMLNRMINAGVESVGEVDLLALLRSVAADERCSPAIRSDARRFLGHQENETEAYIDDEVDGVRVWVDEIVCYLEAALLDELAAFGESLSQSLPGISTETFSHRHATIVHHMGLSCFPAGSDVLDEKCVSVIVGIIGIEGLSVSAYVQWQSPSFHREAETPVHLNPTSQQLEDFCSQVRKLFGRLQDAASRADC